jgi:ABC-2 type transport system permease protein
VTRSRPSRASLVATIMRKDLTELSRDKVWLVLTPLVLVFAVLIFWLMPDTVDETLTIGVYPASLGASLERLALADAEIGLRVIGFYDEEALAAAVRGGDGAGPAVTAGLAFPTGFLLRIMTGQPTEVRVYVEADVPPEVRGALEGGVREMAFMLAGAPVPVTLLPDEQMVLGADRAGAHVSLREQVRPLAVFFVLITESLALASLIATEVGSRTVAAIVATPARVADVVISKGLTGTLLAFSQALLLLILLQGLGTQPLVVLAAVLLGSLLVAAVSLLAGAAGRDFMTTLFIGVLFLVPMMIPAFALLFPGSASWWMQSLPSFGVLEALHGGATLGLGFGDLSGAFASAFAWAAGLFLVGGLVLARRVGRA